MKKVAIFLDFEKCVRFFLFFRAKQVSRIRRKNAKRGDENAHTGKRRVAVV